MRDMIRRMFHAVSASTAFFFAAMNPVLKGLPPLLEAFALFKQGLPGPEAGDPVHRRRVELTRLVLAGPATSVGRERAENPFLK